MAGNAVIGALRVVLGADTAALEKGLKDAQGSLAKFGAGVDKAGIAIGAAMVGAFGVIGMAVKGALDEADKIGKMAQSFGVPVEELSRLKHAADLSDVSLEELGKSVGRLSKNMMEVAGGATGPATQAFKALGIAVTNTDGTLKSSTEVMTTLAGKFEGMEDGAGKTAIAMSLFGKAGASMIPMLNAGSAGLRDMMTEADALGIVISTKTAKAAEGFNDNLTRLGRVKDGLVMGITAELAPALQVLSDRLVQAAKDGGFVKEASSAVMTVMNFLAREIAEVSIRISGLKAEFAGLWKIMANLHDWGAMKEGFKEFNEAGAETERRVQTMRTSLVKFWEETGNAVAATAPEVGKKLAAPIIMANENGQKALDKFFTSTQKRIALMQGDAITTGQTAAAQEQLKTVLQAEAVAKENNIPLTAALTEKIRLLGESAGFAASQLQGANLAVQLQTPAEQFAQKLELQTQLFEQGAISAETYARAQRQASVDAGTAWDVAGASMAGSLATITGAFGKEGSTMAKIAQGLGIVQATIAMFTGAAQALTLPFPANIAAHLKVLATGASMVAGIKSQKVPAFKTGGSFQVPGGVGGGDKVFTPMILEPGEQVDITPNGRGRSAVQPVNVTLQGDNYTREGLRRLIEGLNDMFRDGYKLIPQ